MYDIGVFAVWPEFEHTPCTATAVECAPDPIVFLCSRLTRRSIPVVAVDDRTLWSLGGSPFVTQPAAWRVSMCNAKLTGLVPFRNLNTDSPV